MLAQREGIMRIRKSPLVSFVLNHPTYIGYLLSIVSVALTMAETMILPPNTIWTLVFCIIHMIAVMMLPSRPLLGSNLALASFIICCFIPDDGGPTLLWGTWLSLAYIGLSIKSPIGFMYPLIVSVARMWSFNEAGTPFQESFTLLFIMFFAYYIGRALGWRNMKHQAETNRLERNQLRQRLDTLRKENEAAIHIHDSVAANLTYAAMLLDDKMIQNEYEFTEREISELHGKIMDTLKDVRTAINLMQGEEIPHQTGDSTTAAAKIQSIINSGDESLMRLGFSGKTELSVRSLNHADSRCLIEISSLLPELYTNIAVHASPNSEYFIRITYKDGAMIIDQVNEISDSTLLPDKPASNNGLRLHTERIQSEGGAVKTSSEDGTWQFHASIPVRTNQ